MNKITQTAQTSLSPRDCTAEMMGRFLEYLDVSKKTVETYTRALRQLFGYLAARGISRPRREDVVAFKASLADAGRKSTTIQNYLAAARVFFRWTAQEGLYPNITEHMKGAKVSREHKKDYLTGCQVKRILAGVERDTIQGKRDFAILALMVTCGLRTVEIIRANVEDLRACGGNTALFIQGKGKEDKAEYVKVPEQVEAAIREYLANRGRVKAGEALFTSTSNNNAGGRMTTRAVSGIAKGRMRAAGYDSERQTAHSLRHSAVTLSLLAGKDLAEVQQFARHANIATTMIYNHALDKARNGCSAAVAAEIF